MMHHRIRVVPHFSAVGWGTLAIWLRDDCTNKRMSARFIQDDPSVFITRVCGPAQPTWCPSEACCAVPTGCCNGSSGLTGTVCSHCRLTLDLLALTNRTATARCWSQRCSPSGFRCARLRPAGTAQSVALSFLWEQKVLRARPRLHTAARQW